MIISLQQATARKLGGGVPIARFCSFVARKLYEIEELPEETPRENGYDMLEEMTCPETKSGNELSNTQEALMATIAIYWAVKDYALIDLYNWAKPKEMVELQVERFIDPPKSDMQRANRMNSRDRVIPQEKYCTRDKNLTTNRFITHNTNVGWNAPRIRTEVIPKYLGLALKIS